MKKRYAVIFMLGLAASSHAADPDAGKAKSGSCAGCHGVDGISSNPEWPNLAGQQERYLVNQLKAFKSGVRKDPLMSPIAAPLTEDDIENIAAYFYSLK